MNIISSDMKGITPVIAVILMLALTVAAAGLLWTQFQSLAGQAQSEAGYLNTQDISIYVVSRNTSGGEDYMELQIQNTGESEYNLSEFAELRYKTPGEQVSRPEILSGISEDSSVKTCFDSGTGTQELKQEEIASCNTGVKMPGIGDQITVQLTQSGAERGSGKISDYTCSPESSGSSTC